MKFAFLTHMYIWIKDNNNSLPYFRIFVNYTFSLTELNVSNGKKKDSTNQ